MRVTSWPTEHFSVQTLTCPCYFVHRFALPWLPYFTLLGKSAPQTFGLCLLSLNFPPWLVMIWPTLSLRQQLLRSNFVPTMRRNLTFGSASSRPSSQRQGIRSQKLKYANALASLPKQALWNILDTMDVCNDSDEPFDCLKDALLGQFGKSSPTLNYFASL